MGNRFSTQSQPTSPATTAVAITPSDDTDLSEASRAIYVGVGGNIKLTTADGQTVTFVGLQGGSILPVSAVRIFDTDTTATSIVALV